MQWSDEALVLSARPHGETAMVVRLFTLQHGCHAGLVRGRTRQLATCQPGNRVRVGWRGRLPEQLGSYTLELEHPAASLLLDDASRLCALSSACALVEKTLPEREPMPELYLYMRAFAAELAQGEMWAAHYLALELELLSRLGYGLELSACAATGAAEDLAYVSPKSGHAVSRDSGAPYHDRLLKLPDFLRRSAAGGGVDTLPSPAEIIDGFRLTGYFLDKHVFQPHNAALPAARGRLIQQFQASYA